MRAVASVFLLSLLALLSPGTSLALTLRHDDLVALRGSDVIRVDTTTGAQDLIASGAPTADLAVAVGGRTIYSVGGDTLAAIDPATGTVTPLATGFHSAGGVAVNATGDVFVLDNQPGPGSSGFSQPAIHRVDPTTGATSLVFSSNLPSSEGPGAGTWIGTDLEIAADGTLAALGREGDSTSSPFGACCQTSGVISIDLHAPQEALVLSSDLLALAYPGEWIQASALGFDAWGRIISSGDADRAGRTVAYDPVTGQIARAGLVWGVRDDTGATVVQMGGPIDFTTTPDGRMWASGAFGYPGGAGGAFVGIHSVGLGECLECPGDIGFVSQLVDGAAFSAALGITEIQPVVIPEPSVATLLSLGLALLGGAAPKRAVEA